MVEYLSFERCKPDNGSRYFKLFKKDEGYYLEIAAGFRGMYIVGNNTMYKCRDEDADKITILIEPLKIYTWPKAFPSDYSPEDHLMGCDTDSWSIEYKEVEKKTMRHVNGRGAFPETGLYGEFFLRISRLIPDRELMEWLTTD